MATEEKSESRKFTLIVIGGGSGGLATAKRAAEYIQPHCVEGWEPNNEESQILLIEEQTRSEQRVRLGGTCVNVGCVPKKTMWYTATMAEMFKVHAEQYGFNIAEGGLNFNFGQIKGNRDAYVERLDNIYESGVTKKGIVCVHGTAKFLNRNTVQVGDQRYEADFVVLACGGRPYNPPFKEPYLDVANADKENNPYFKTSDEYFYNLDRLPKKIAVVGAGYIAVELGQVMQMLGSDVSIFIRNPSLLRTFDKDIQKRARKALRHSNLKIMTSRNVVGIELEEQPAEYDPPLEEQKENRAMKKTIVATEKGGDANVLLRYGGFDEVIYAIGRGPNKQELDLDAAQVQQFGRGFVKSDAFERCLDKETGDPIDNLFAVGDINNKFALTPVAIRAGRALADRVFGGQDGKICEYDNIPSVVFTHPPIGACGLTEMQVIDGILAGDMPEPLTVYTSNFGSSFNALYPRSELRHGGRRGIQCFVKMLCVGEEEKVVGLHLIGDGSDEMLQGFGVAMRMNATKADFDNVVAIHPTGAEEVVTMRGGKRYGRGDLEAHKAAILQKELEEFVEEAKEVAEIAEADAQKAREEAANAQPNADKQVRAAEQATFVAAQAAQAVVAAEKNLASRL